MAAIWAGIDAGKTHHHCVAIDESGRRLLSRRVANDEPDLLELLTDVLALGNEVWGIDLADGIAALATAILLNHDQLVHYIPGRAINRASESYRGEGKTDAKDAAVIADQVRIRRDLQPLRPATRPPSIARSLPAAAWTWSLTAPAPSTGCAPTHRTLPRPRAGAGSHEHRPAHPADRLPDPGCPAPTRHQTAGDLAAQPQRSQRRPARADGL